MMGSRSHELLHRTLLQRRSAAKSEEEDDVFVRPKLPARVTRSSSQRTKAKEAKAAAKKNSPEEGGEQSASDSTSDFEELGTEEAMSPQSTSSE